MFHCARHVILYLVLVQHRKRPDMAENFLTGMGGSRGGTGGPDPPPSKRSQKIGFLSNTGPDPLKNRKATWPEFDIRPLLRRQRNAIRWKADDGTLLVVFLSSLLSSTKKTTATKNNKKSQSWTPSYKKFLDPRMTGM